MDKDANLTGKGKLPAIIEKHKNILQEILEDDSRRYNAILHMSKIDLAEGLLEQTKHASISFSEYRKEQKERRRRRAEKAEIIPGVGTVLGAAAGALASSNKGKMVTRTPLGGLLGYVAGNIVKANRTSPAIDDDIARDRKRYERMNKHAALHGGLAEKAHKTEKDFDPKSLARGAKVESEHTSDKKLRREIAMDHLTEDPHYYEKLEKMEKNAYSLNFLRTHVYNGLVDAGKNGWAARERVFNILDKAKNEDEAVAIGDAVMNAQHTLGAKDRISDLRIPGWRAVWMKKMDRFNMTPQKAVHQFFPNHHMPQDRDIVTLEKNGAEVTNMFKALNGGTKIKSILPYVEKLKSTVKPIENVNTNHNALRMALGAALKKEGGLYRDALAFGSGYTLPEAMAQVEEKDDVMDAYMHSLMQKRAEGIVDTELREQQERQDDLRKYKYGLVKTDTHWKKWGSVHKPLFKQAVGTTRLEAEDPKFMERDYQQRPQKWRLLREAANDESILGFNTVTA